MSAYIRVGSMIDLAHYYASVVDARRFESERDRVLAAVGDENYAWYPEADVLAGRGFNLEFIALALESGNLAATEIGDIVDDVEFGDGDFSVADANQEIFASMTTEDQKVIDLEDHVLAGLGFRVPDVRACMRLGRLDDSGLRELVANVCNRVSDLDNVNTGLAYRADPAFAA
jgi:hypothetical protein